MDNKNYSVDDILAEIKSRNVNEHDVKKYERQFICSSHHHEVMSQFMCSSTRLRNEVA